MNFKIPLDRFFVSIITIFVMIIMLTIAMESKDAIASILLWLLSFIGIFATYTIIYKLINWTIDGFNKK